MLRLFPLLTALFAALSLSIAPAASQTPAKPQAKSAPKAAAGAKAMPKAAAKPAPKAAPRPAAKAASKPIAHKPVARKPAAQQQAQRAAAQRPCCGATARRAALAPSPPPPEVFNPDFLEVQSTAALVINPTNGQVIYEKNTGNVAPIASITKLMTAMVVLDAKLPLDESIELSREDLEHLRGTGSRLSMGMSLTRDEMLRLTLMSSENRVAVALARSYPGGIEAFVREMNMKAMALDMMQTSFADSTGLSSDNVSTARDLAKLVKAAYQYPLIRQYSTGMGYAVYTPGGRTLQYGNSNSLMVSPDWQINLQKTGYIRAAGRCVVMHATIANSPIVIVLLDAWGPMSRVGDANRIKRWIEYHSNHTLG
ncbi:MAG: D-alanyl-D-alanine endopeptidase [Betaproteobacteria bacterium]|nr:D-alanyl-D-alanine endopeptidase [Betaproteobacteria bacterium]